MYLVDTNIFLEILLGQDKKADCKRFLVDNAANIKISDFSLHSIGVILFRYGKEEVFKQFVSDIALQAEIISLSSDMISDTVLAKKKYGLDFDDAYQYALAGNNGLEIVTMDRDFSAVEKETNITFL